MSSDRKRSYLPIIALVLFCSLAYLITQSKPEASAGKKGKGTTLNVKVSQVEAKDLPVVLDSFGTLRAKTQTDLFPLVSGRVLSVSANLEAGGFFKKGDVLLKIEPDDYLIELEIAKGNVAKAELALAEERARHEQAKRDWKKQKKDELATELALRFPQLKAANAELNTAQARLRLAELNVSRTEVKAPYNGRILSTFVNIGSVVSANSKIASIYSSDAVQVRLPIANKDLPYFDLPDNHLTKITGVTIENPLAEPSEFWRSSLVRTEAAIDAQSQQLFIVADIASPFTKSENKQPLKIGQYVKARIQGEVIEDAVVVPNATIYQGSYVYVVEDELLLRRPIKVSWRNEEISVIENGLTQGDLLVETLLGQVISGTKVKITNIETVNATSDKNVASSENGSHESANEVTP